jgi:hypothetical protein
VRLTRGFPVVGKVGNEQSLGIHYHDGVRGDEMNTVQLVYLLRPGVVQIFGYLNISEINLQKGRNNSPRISKKKAFYSGLHKFSEFSFMLVT